uniref:Neurexin/syndecan/glycophorin C domain-containing protein n=1 Tax=Neogobius melanostomus TaxID=47308 RepID=A0A8C6SIL5_9GOBI
MDSGNTLPFWPLGKFTWRPRPAKFEGSAEVQRLSPNPCNKRYTRSPLSGLPSGVVSVVIFVVLCFLVFLVRHLFRHKGSYHTNEAKGQESADCADAAIIVSDPAFTETIEESKKEWFI